MLVMLTSRPVASPTRTVTCQRGARRGWLRAPAVRRRISAPPATINTIPRARARYMSIAATGIRFSSQMPATAPRIDPDASRPTVCQCTSPRNA